jgi:hypothetical protein
MKIGGADATKNARGLAVVVCIAVRMFVCGTREEAHYRAKSELLLAGSPGSHEFSDSSRANVDLLRMPTPRRPLAHFSYFWIHDCVLHSKKSWQSVHSPIFEHSGSTKIEISAHTRNEHHGHE